MDFEIGRGSRNFRCSCQLWHARIWPPKVLSWDAIRMTGPGSETWACGNFNWLWVWRRCRYTHPWSRHPLIIRATTSVSGHGRRAHTYAEACRNLQLTRRGMCRLEMKYSEAARFTSNRNKGDRDRVSTSLPRPLTVTAKVPHVAFFVPVVVHRRVGDQLQTCTYSSRAALYFALL